MSHIWRKARVWGWNARLMQGSRLNRKRDARIWQGMRSLRPLRSTRERDPHILWWMWSLRFIENATLTSKEGTWPSRLIGNTRFASKIETQPSRVWHKARVWGIVINHFLTAYRAPPKFSKLRSRLKQISKYFGSRVALHLRDCTGNLLKCPYFRECTVELLKAPERIVVSVLLNLLKCIQKHSLKLF